MLKKVPNYVFQNSFYWKSSLFLFKSCFCLGTQDHAVPGGGDDEEEQARQGDERGRARAEQVPVLVFTSPLPGLWQVCYMGTLKVID